jgi:serine protease AprX
MPENHILYRFDIRRNKMLNQAVGYQLKRFSLIALVIMLFFSWMAVPAGNIAQAEFGSFIVRGSSAQEAARLVESYGGEVTSHLDIIHGVGAVLPLGRLSELAAHPARLKISPNALVKSAEEGVWPETDYPNVVGADIPWENGIVGDGITVAVLDTGMSNHQAVLRDITGNKGRVVGWKDFVDGRPSLYDPNGHGTHVAGIIAATQLGTDGEWNGVAPGVNLLPIRVLNRQGYGTYEQVIQGINWVVANKDVFGVRVMNLSLVALAQSPYWADPLNLAVMRAWADGIVVVAAAGNGGPGPMTIGVPGNVPYVITVGAFTDDYTPYNWNDDYLAPFSAAGPTLDGFVKPDVVAPGAHMVAPMNPGAQLALTYPDNKVIPQYFSMAGTSQAAAVVSGIAALVLEYNPDLEPYQVKYRLMKTALPWFELAFDKDGEPDFLHSPAGYSMWQQGAGRVNAVDAVFADNIDPESGYENFGMDIWGDIDGEEPSDHYQGFTCYDDEAGEFRIMNPLSGLCEQYLSWDSGYGAWSGGYGAWSGGYGAWSGGYGAWSGGYGAWSGGYGAWSGGYGAWSGGYGAWSGGYGAWSGGYGAWSGGYGAWSGSYFGTPVFYDNFISGETPDPNSTVTSLGEWVEE